jgi:GAF domain-containing protein
MLHEITLLEKQTKEQKYISLLPQLFALVEGETDVIANLANISAGLKSNFGWWWVGFYIVKGNELVLGPFQGTIACTRIAFELGVCGSSWKQKQTIIVDDVEQFAGHIACSSLSRSEIVIPIIKNEIVIGVLDVDSENLANFDATDKKYLEKLANFIASLF